MLAALRERVASSWYFYLAFVVSTSQWECRLLGEDNQKVSELSTTKNINGKGKCLLTTLLRRLLCKNSRAPRSNDFQFFVFCSCFCLMGFHLCFCRRPILSYDCHCQVSNQLFFPLSPNINPGTWKGIYCLPHDWFSFLFWFQGF